MLPITEFCRRLPVLCTFWAVVAVVVSGCSSGPNRQEPPNILIIMADDMGYSDVGSYGGEISTPNIDRLAENGLRLTQFYNMARCCPTRASLLTGLYPHEAGVGAMTFDRGQAGYRGFLTDNTATIAEILGGAGYQTGMVGKWHLSLTQRRADPEEQLRWLAHLDDYGTFSDTSTYPAARGFDDYFGNIWGVVDYFDPFSLVNGFEAVPEVPDDYYYTDAINDSAASYVRRYSRQDSPFFLYVAHTAPHWPLHALPEDIAKYEDTYKVGWDSIRTQRYRRMVEMGLFDPETTPLPERHEAELEWSENPDSVWDARAMAVHAAMIDRMDQGIGRIIEALEDTGELENTLVFFLSDNGASPERPSEYGPGFDRAGLTRAGATVHFPVEKDVLPGPQETHAGIGPIWAHVSNTPFRYWKGTEYHGGAATPLIVHWPNGIQLDPGSIVRSPGLIMDIMATSIDVANVPYPDTLNDRQITALQGKSLAEVLETGDRDDYGLMFWEHTGSAAARDGNWRMVRLNQESPWELYDVDSDLSETRNLADQNSDTFSYLQQTWDTWADTSNVRPK